MRALGAPVEIVRDNSNVPHVFGQSDPDVFFGLGYAHAQDRLWQMTTMRRAAQGRLSEVFGTRTIETDKLLRRFDLYRLADPEELEFMGIRDYFMPDSLCLIEWPQRGFGLLPQADLELTLSYIDQQRLARLEANTVTGEKIIEQLK